jgi:Transposase DDE domain
LKRPDIHQPLRQTEGLLRAIAAVLDVGIRIPDHTTVSRRGGGLTILPSRIRRDEPLHLLVDSTGLKIYGEGEWLDQQHGVRARRRWRKLHLGVDADTHDIVVSELTPDDVGDVSEVPELLDQVDGGIASMTADGAYDSASVYDSVAERPWCMDPSGRRYPGRIGPAILPACRSSSTPPAVIAFRGPATVSKIGRSTKPASNDAAT